MEKILAFSQYLEVLGFDLGKITFEEAIALHSDVEKTIERAFVNSKNEQ